MSACWQAGRVQVVLWWLNEISQAQRSERRDADRDCDWRACLATIYPELGGVRAGGSGLDCGCSGKSDGVVWGSGELCLVPHALLAERHKGSVPDEYGRPCVG